MDALFRKASLCCAIFVTFGLVTEILTIDAFAQQTQAVDLTSKIETLVHEEFQPELPGGAAIVLKGGEQIYRTARGMANLELDVPLKPEMVFRIGSITKQFTAAAIMILVEEEKLNLDDEISEHLEDYPTQGTTITVRHLLNHTSGIRSYTSMPGWMQTKIVNDYSPDEIIEGFKNEPMDFKPGEKFLYNNSGYILLGAIIERVSGKTYAEFVNERIFEPLGMDNSYYGSHSAVIPNRASGYDGSDKHPQNAKFLSMTQPYAAGSLLSNVEDLGKWNSALFAGKVVNNESLKLMSSKGALNDGSEFDYGLGLTTREIRGHQAIEHGGGIFGFLCQGVYLPEQDIYVAVLANSTFKDPTSLAFKIAALVAGDPYPEFQPAEVGEEVLQSYVGVYKIDDSERRFVTIRDGQLFTQRSGGGILAATPHSETGFYYKAASSNFEFVLEDGEVKGMNMFQEGSKQPEWAEKVDEPVPAEKEAVEINFELYDDYVGVYEFQGGMELTVSRDGNQLFATPTGQDPKELLPSSDTQFYPKGMDATLKFVRDADKKVESVELEMSGQQLKGQRKK